VLAGWVGGLVWALLVWLVARHLQRKGAVERDAEKLPGDPGDDENETVTAPQAP
jgi:hypothetical protein